MSVYVYFEIMDDKTWYPHQHHKLWYQSDFHFLKSPVIYYMIMHKVQAYIKNRTRWMKLERS
jgi:hypothetical protein